MCFLALFVSQCFMALKSISLCSFSGKSSEEASDLGLAYMKERVQGLGGVVTVDPKGNWAARFSSLQMAWAAVQGEQLHYGLYVGEHFTESAHEPP